MDLGQSARNRNLPLNAKFLLQRIFKGENYLAVFVAGVPLAVLFEDIYGGEAVLKGQPWYVLVPFVFAAISGIFWLRFNRIGNYSKSTLTFLIAMIFAWSILISLEIIDGLAHNYTTYLVPVILLMLIFKPISANAALRVGNTLAWATILVIVISFVHDLFRGEQLPALGIRLPGVSLAVFEGARWVGPFENPNYAGPIVAFLLIYAFAKTGWQRWIFMVSGATLVLMSGSRSAFLGSLAGLIIIFIYSRSPSLERIGRGAKAAIVGAIFIAFSVIGIAVDPTLNGRTPIWPEYWRMWLVDPLTGIGTQEIQSRISAGEIGPEFVHAHNLFLDLLGRYGIVGFISITLVLGLALAVAIGAARRSDSLSLALVLTFLTIGLVEVHGSWLYWSIPTCWLLIAVLVGSRQPKTKPLNN